MVRDLVATERKSRHVGIALAARAVERLLQDMKAGDGRDRLERAVLLAREVATDSDPEHPSLPEWIDRATNLSRLLERSAEEELPKLDRWDSFAQLRAGVHLCAAIVASIGTPTYVELALESGADTWAWRSDKPSRARQEFRDAVDIDRKALERYVPQRAVSKEFFQRPLWPT